MLLRPPQNQLPHLSWENVASNKRKGKTKKREAKTDILGKEADINAPSSESYYEIVFLKRLAMWGKTTMKRNTSRVPMLQSNKSHTSRTQRSANALFLLALQAEKDKKEHTLAQKRHLSH